MPFKVSYLFNLGPQGWSQNFYWTGAFVPNAAPTIPDDVDAVATALLGCASPPVKLVGIRITDDVNPRQTQLYVIPRRPALGTVLTDYPTNVPLAIAKGPGGFGTRQIWFHGTADAYIDYNPNFQTFVWEGAFQTAFNNLVNVLVGKAFCVKVRQKVKGNPNVGIIPALTVNAATGAVSLGTTFGAIDSTKPIIVGGLKYDLQHLNGVYQPNTGWGSIGGSISILNRGVTSKQATGYPGGGTVRQLNSTYLSIATATLEFIRERRIGRAFFVPRGRRPSK